jgi:hypothetical protein
METNKLSRAIMRRVYYTYAIRAITTPGVLQGLAMFAILVALTQFVSLGNVIQNLMHVEVGYLGTFFMNAINATEIWTLVLLGAFIMAALSFRFKIVAHEHVPQYVNI